MSILDHAPLGHILGDASGLDTDALLAQMKADLHPGQLEFVDDETSQILAISAGYGAGKTRSLCCKAVSLAIANQGYVILTFSSGFLLQSGTLRKQISDHLRTFDVPISF